MAGAWCFSRRVRDAGYNSAMAATWTSLTARLVGRALLDPRLALDCFAPPGPSAAGTGGPGHRSCPCPTASTCGGACTPPMPTRPPYRRRRTWCGSRAGDARQWAFDGDGPCTSRRVEHRESAPRRDPGGRVRRAVCRQGAAPHPGAPHRRRPPESPSVPAHALPGGDGGPQSRRHRLAHPVDTAQVEEHRSAAGRSGRHRRRRPGRSASPTAPRRATTT